jgi:hypothetical protein
MPALNTNTITNAMYGDTQLSAVYKGDTKIWEAKSVYTLTLGAARWVRNGTGGCTRGNRYELYITGIHNIDLVREYECNYLQGGIWITGTWRNDTFTLPNVNFDLRTLDYMCTNSAGSAPTARMRFRLSDGTVTSWSYTTTFLESEIENG